MSEPIRIDRRTTIKWILAASAALPALDHAAFAASTSAGNRTAAAAGYGSDPDLVRIYRPGDVWPLTFAAPQRRTAATLCDVILPEDAGSPPASAVGVVDFIDEWISAPYPAQQEDRRIILAGLTWLEQESSRRFDRRFGVLAAADVQAICDEICYLPNAPAERAPAAKFFARFRDLTVGGFYTTPEGTRDIRYVGNVALAHFDGPPPEVLRAVGLDRNPPGGAA